MPAREHMNVQMIHRLTAVGAGVHDEAKAAGILRADHCGSFHQSRDFVGRPFERVLRDIRYVPLRQNEQVHRRLRVHVLDRDYAVLAMHDLRGYFACDDLAENAVVIHATSGVGIQKRCACRGSEQNLQWSTSQ
jgi:hypothetical protein